MKIEVRWEPFFTLHLTPEHITALERCSALHYDATCRAASVSNGFLWGWHTQVAFEGGPVGCRATLWELGLVLKICEMPPPGVSAIVLMDLRQSIRTALQAAGREIEPEVVQP